MWRAWLEIAAWRTRELVGAAAATALLVAVALAALLPPIADLALAAAPRVVADLGLNGVRVASLAFAISAGLGSVGPALRRGEADLFWSLAAPPRGWILARLLGTLAPTLATSSTLFLVYGSVAASMGLSPPPGVTAWVLGFLVEISWVTLLAASAGVLLPGPAAALAATLLVLGGHLGLFLEGVPWAEAPLARGVWLVWPQLWRLDVLPSLMRGDPPPTGELALRLLYACFWCVGLAGLILTSARPSPRRG